jgi:hypothetical protein
MGLRVVIARDPLYWYVTAVPPPADQWNCGWLGMSYRRLKVIGCSHVRYCHPLSDPDIRTLEHNSDGDRDGVPSLNMYM